MGPVVSRRFDNIARVIGSQYRTRCRFDVEGDIRTDTAAGTIGIIGHDHIQYPGGELVSGVAAKAVYGIEIKIAGLERRVDQHIITFWITRMIDVDAMPATAETGIRDIGDRI